MNYIKRLIGKPGQVIGILNGDVYVTTEARLAEALALHGLGTYEDDPNEARLEERRRMRRNHEGARIVLTEGKICKDGKPCFQILRKPASKIPAMSRIVYDHDYPAKDLSNTPFVRWDPKRDGSTWQTDGPHGFHHPAGESAAMDWLRYRNLLRPRILTDNPPPSLITDFMGYNSGSSEPQPDNWVGDLILECEVKVEKPEGKLVLELSKGYDRFQARWDLPTGKCTLVRLTTQPGGSVSETVLTPDGKDSALKKRGRFDLRFANVDQRLTVWVDGDLVFGEGVEYGPPREGGAGNHGKILTGPYEPNDIQPASLGADGAEVRVQHLKLWRDTYYTNKLSGREEYYTFHVRPGHYFCLGDNSFASSDSRVWSETILKDGRDQPRDNHGGLVPENLMLGRALVIYWPLSRVGRIR
jgi:signal peptidase I